MAYIHKYLNISFSWKFDRFLENILLGTKNTEPLYMQFPPIYDLYFIFHEILSVCWIFSKIHKIETKVVDFIESIKANQLLPLWPQEKLP